MALNVKKVDKKNKADEMLEKLNSDDSYDTKNASELIHANLNKMYVEKDVIPDNPDNCEQQWIPLSLLVENKENEYLFGGVDDDSIASLQEDIEENGFKGILNVWKLLNGKYEIVSGHRRYRALKNLNVEKVLCWVSEYPESKSKRDWELIKYNILSRGSIHAAANGKSIYITRQINRLREILTNNNFKGDKTLEIARLFTTSDRTIQQYSSLETCSKNVLQAEESGIITLQIASSLSSLPEEAQDIIVSLLTDMHNEGYNAKALQKASSELKKDFSLANFKKIRASLLSELAIADIFNDDPIEDEKTSTGIKRGNYSRSDAFKKSKRAFTRWYNTYLPEITDETEKKELIEQLQNIIEALQ